MKKFLLTTAAIILTATIATTAIASQKVRSPYVKKGQFAFETFNTHNFDDRDSKDGKSKGKFEFGYGVTDYWKPEIEIVYEDAPGQSFKITAYELVNKFQLWDKGTQPFDAGLYLAWEKHTDNSKADKLEGFILLAKEFDKWRHRTNIMFKKEVGENNSKDVEFELAWQTAYKYEDGIKFGFEYYGDWDDLSQTGDFDEQSHQIGPVAIFDLPWGHTEFKVGYLAALSDAAPDHTIKWEFEYKF